MFEMKGTTEVIKIFSVEPLYSFVIIKYNYFLISTDLLG